MPENENQATAANSEIILPAGNYALVSPDYVKRYDELEEFKSRIRLGNYRPDEVGTVISDSNMYKEEYAIARIGTDNPGEITAIKVGDRNLCLPKDGNYADLAIIPVGSDYDELQQDAPGGYNPKLRDIVYLELEKDGKVSFKDGKLNIGEHEISLDPVTEALTVDKTLPAGKYLIGCLGQVYDHSETEDAGESYLVPLIENYMGDSYRGIAISKSPDGRDFALVNMPQDSGGHLVRTVPVGNSGILISPGENYDEYAYLAIIAVNDTTQHNSDPFSNANSWAYLTLKQEGEISFEGDNLKIGEHLIDVASPGAFMSSFPEPGVYVDMAEGNNAEAYGYSRLQTDEHGFLLQQADAKDNKNIPKELAEYLEATEVAIMYYTNPRRGQDESITQEIEQEANVLRAGTYLVSTIEGAACHPECQNISAKNGYKVPTDAFDGSQNVVVGKTPDGQDFAALTLGPDSEGVMKRTIQVGDSGVLVEPEFFSGSMDLVIHAVTDATQRSQNIYAPQADDYAYITLAKDGPVAMEDGKLTIGEHVVDLKAPGAFMTSDGVYVDMAEKNNAQAYGYKDMRSDEHGVYADSLNKNMPDEMFDEVKAGSSALLYYANPRRGPDGEFNIEIAKDTRVDVNRSMDATDAFMAQQRRLGGGIGG